jgi:hypothetical protein
MECFTNTRQFGKTLKKARKRCDVQRSGVDAVMGWFLFRF